MKKCMLFSSLSIILFFSTSNCGAQIINTVVGNGYNAGTGNGGYAGDGGPALAAELGNPAGIVLDKSGNIYIADYYNNVVRKVTKSTGIITTIAGNGYDAETNMGGYSGDGGQATAAELFLPTSVALDSLGNIYIADYFNNRIRMVNASTGIITTVAGNGTGAFSGDGGQATAAELYQPSGVVIDHSGNLYIADAKNNRIRKVVLSTGIISTVAGNGTAAYSGDGGQATAAELDYPQGLAVDDTGNIFITDWGNSCIRKVRIRTGVITTVAGNGNAAYMGDGGQATAAELNYPIDVKLDSIGNLYIADALNHRLRMVNASTGIISTVAGNGTSGFTGNGGLATSAELDYPDGIGFDRYGNIYFADGFNNVIQEVTESDAGIQQLKNPSNITVYPNPSNGQFTFVIPSGAKQSPNNTVEVYNMLGEKVYSQLSIAHFPLSIDMRNLPDGVYLYKILANNGELIGDGKLVVQK